MQRGVQVSYFVSSGRLDHVTYSYDERLSRTMERKRLNIVLV